MLMDANVAHYTFEIEGSEEVFRVVKYSGEEQISRPFLFTLEVAVENRQLNFSDIIGKVGIFRVHELKTKQVRYVHGIVTRFDQGLELKRFSCYHIDLVPYIHLLNYRTHSRIYQQKSVPDIIKSILEALNISTDYFELSLSGNYPPREYCVQYRETDLSFIHRLMEEEGIFYYFEHASDLHKMIIGDNSYVHKDVENPELIYSESSNFHTEKTISDFRYSESIKPGSVLLKDFNFEKPALNLKVQKQATIDQHLEIYDYPGAYVLPERGNVLAKLKLESIQATKITITANSQCRYLLPGYCFDLTLHPRADYNRKYLVTSLKQSGTQPQVLEEEVSSTETRFESSIVCVPSDVTFRPLQQTRKPKVEGVQTAMVVGPPDEEIYTDKFGRIKVQFHWDLEGQYDENSSCWIRVNQVAASAGFGSMFIPRIGDEVIVDFLEGDPDRPIVTGRVYYATNMPPFALPDQKSVCGMKTNSTPGGGGANEFSMDDTKGKEKMTINAQYNMSTNVGNDNSTSITNNNTMNIGVDDTETIGSNRTISVGANDSIDVGAARSVNVGGDSSVDVGGKRSVTVGGDYLLNASGSISETAPSKITLTCGGSSITLEPGKITISAGGGSTLTLDAAALMESSAGDKVALNGKATMSSPGECTVDAPKSTLSGGGSTAVADAGGVTVTGAKISLNG